MTVVSDRKGMMTWHVALGAYGVVVSKGGAGSSGGVKEGVVLGAWSVLTEGKRRGK